MCEMCEPSVVCIDDTKYTVQRASRQHAARLFIQVSFNQNRHRTGSSGTINRLVTNRFVVKTSGAAVVPIRHIGGGSGVDGWLAESQWSAFLLCAAMMMRTLRKTRWLPGFGTTRLIYRHFLLKLRGPLISPKESEPDGQAATIDSSRQAASIFLAQSLREVQSCKPQKRSNLLLSLLVPFLQSQKEAHY